VPLLERIKTSEFTQQNGFLADFQKVSTEFSLFLPENRKFEVNYTRKNAKKFKTFRIYTGKTFFLADFSKISTEFRLFLPENRTF